MGRDIKFVKGSSGILLPAPEPHLCVVPMDTSVQFLRPGALARGECGHWWVRPSNPRFVPVRWWHFGARKRIREWEAQSHVIVKDASMPRPRTDRYGATLDAAEGASPSTTDAGLCAHGKVVDVGDGACGVCDWCPDCNQITEYNVAGRCTRCGRMWGDSD